MKKLKAFLLAVTMVVSLTGCTAEVKKEENNPKSEPSETETEFDLSAIRPQDDYYGYINAEKLWNDEIEYGYDSKDSFFIAAKNVEEEQKAILQGILESQEEFEPGSPQQLIRDYYYQYISEKQDYTSEFDKVFELIDAAETPDDIVKLGGEMLKNYGVNFLFSMTITPNYFKNDEYAIVIENPQTFFDQEDFKKSTDSQIEVRDTLKGYLTGFGIDYDEAEKRANDIVYYYVDCVNKTDYDALSTYAAEVMLNYRTKEQVAEILSNINFDNYEPSYNIKGYDYADYIVQFPEVLAVTNEYLTEDNLQMWKDMAKCSYVMTYEAFAPNSYLSYEKTEENKPEDEVISDVLHNMAYEISELYYNEYYTDEYKAAMAVFEADMKKAYVEMINESEWLSDEGKALMVKKFNNIKFHFGGQEKYNHSPSDAALIGVNAYETKRNFIKKQFNDYVNKIGTVPDYDEWDMMSQEVNAYYNPSANNIYIPRGIMHPPFYDINGDYYANLGGLGETIGHELSHAFDSNGIQFNADGNYDPEWISQADRDAFELVQQKAIDFYDKMTLLDVYHVDGKITLGENLADLGALQCVLHLADKDEDKIKIFENYAAQWYSMYTNTSVIESLTKDVHAPNLIRMNSVLMNTDDFQRIFDVQEGDGMYVAPENRVKRW